MCAASSAPTTSAPSTTRCLAAMSEAIAHRGPDAVGAWSGPGDPPRGAARAPAPVHHRPVGRGQLFVKDGLVLVFCGEIDNYRELKAELGAAGTGFRTDSDTEVLLEAWRRWGRAASAGCAACSPSP